jgi:hypothetical protein
MGRREGGRVVANFSQFPWVIKSIAAHAAIFHAPRDTREPGCINQGADRNKKNVLHAAAAKNLHRRAYVHGERSFFIPARAVDRARFVNFQKPLLIFASTGLVRECVKYLERPLKAIRGIGAAQEKPTFKREHANLLSLLCIYKCARIFHNSLLAPPWSAESKSSGKMYK